MDITIQAMSGVMSITGEDSGPPMKAGAALCDFLGGVHLYGGIVSALFQREQTGSGAVLDISMQDCVFPTLTTALGAYFLAGEQKARTGNRHPGLSAAPYNVYESKDGHVAMICIRDGHWRKLCNAMDRPELADDSRFVDMKSRSLNMDLLDDLITGWTKELSKEEIFKKLSDSAKPKLEIVIGNNKRADAKIAGITPAVLILRGKCEDSPPYILFPTCLFG